MNYQLQILVENWVITVITIVTFFSAALSHAQHSVSELVLTEDINFTLVSHPEVYGEVIYLAVDTTATNSTLTANTPRPPPALLWQLGAV